MGGAIVYVEADGPYVVTGDFTLVAPAAPRDGASVVLCRCGGSSNKPYCDGTHTKIGFADGGVVPDAFASRPGAAVTPVDRPTIVPTPDGPLKCTGPLTLSGADGVARETAQAKLCRCGASASKPFCDGSHKRIMFAS